MHVFFHTYATCFELPYSKLIYDISTMILSDKMTIIFKDYVPKEIGL